MNDQITQTTHTSWFSRLGGALSGVLVGFVMVLICVGVLFWNEGRAVKTAKGLKEGAASVVSVSADRVDPANEGKLVHVSGPSSVTAPLVDADFGVSATGLRLARKVEMYQWRETSRSETRTRLGGGQETVTTYSYEKVWSPSAEDSSAFNQPAGHQNPRLDVEGTEVLARDAKLGAFRLDEGLVARVGGGTALSLTPDLLPRVREAAGRLRRHVAISDNQILLSAQPASNAVQGAPAPEPTVGDLKITYQLVPAGEVSVAARQDRDGFGPYSARNGETLLLVSTGRVAASEMFKGAQDANAMMTWALRGGGLVLLMVGFGLILAPLAVVADVLPIAGTVVRMGTGLVGFVLALLVASAVIALAWFAFRPLLTVGILVVGGGVAFVAWRYGRGRAKTAEASEATAAQA